MTAQMSSKSMSDIVQAAQAANIPITGLTTTGNLHAQTTATGAMLADVYAAAIGTRAKTSDDIVLRISAAQNGRLVVCNGRTYIVPDGTPILEVINQAIVELKLEG